jgi:hypothetical protein
VILAAPSALYYDTALLLITFGVAIAWFGRSRGVAVVMAIALSWSQLLASPLGWSPLFLPVFGVAIMLALGARRMPGSVRQPVVS